MNLNISKNFLKINYNQFNPEDHPSFHKNEQKLQSYIHLYTDLEMKKYDYISIYPPNITEQNNPEIDEANIIINNNIYCDNSKERTKEDIYFNDKVMDNNIYLNNSNNNYTNFSLKEEEGLSNYLNSKKDLRTKKEKNRRKNINFDNPIKLVKLSNSNMIRKCKNLILSYSLEYINLQIKNIYNGDIGEGVNRKKLLDIGQEQKADNTINSIRLFFNKTLKEIFSADISSKYTSVLRNNNKILISKMLNEKDEDKKNKFIKLFNYTFSDCLHKFLGHEKDDKLEGFPIFDDVRTQLNEEEAYLDKIKYFMENFEEIIKNSNPRKKSKRKSKKKNNNNSINIK